MRHPETAQNTGSNTNGNGDNAGTDAPNDSTSPEGATDISGRFLVRIPTNPIPSEILEKSNLPTANESNIRFRSLTKKDQYHTAFNKGIRDIRRTVNKIAEESGQQYNKVEHDVFAASAMKKGTRAVKPRDTFYSMALAEINKGPCV
jgi:hypothetical protein